MWRRLHKISLDQLVVCSSSCMHTSFSVTYHRSFDTVWMRIFTGAMLRTGVECSAGGFLCTPAFISLGNTSLHPFSSSYDHPCRSCTHVSCGMRLSRCCDVLQLPAEPVKYATPCCHSTCSGRLSWLRQHEVDSEASRASSSGWQLISTHISMGLSASALQQSRS